MTQLRTIPAIANPAAGSGRALRRWLAAKDAAEAAGLQLDPVPTDGPGHATELARRAVDDGAECVVAIGGDGTVREIASGLVGTNTALGVLPVGSGNDFARSIGVPLNARRAVQVLRDGVVRSVDVGEDSSGLFTCVGGIGFAAEVSHEAANSTLFRGSAAYFVGVFKALARLRPTRMRVQLDEECLDVEAIFVMAQNTPYCGGGQLMAPGALLDDGKLDVVIVGPVTRSELVRVLPRVYSGGHQHHPAVSIHRSSRVEVISDDPLRKILDGDVVGLDPLCARTRPNALRVIAPHVSKSASPSVTP